MSLKKAYNLASSRKAGKFYAEDEILNFGLVMGGFEKQFLAILKKNKAQAKKEINLWLDDLERTYSSKMRQINLVAGYGGFALSQMAGDQEVSPGLYKQAFEDQVQALSSVDLVEARILRNALATRLKKNFEKIYAEYDQMAKESLGLNLDQMRAQLFEKAIWRDNIALIDRSGRAWGFEQYSTMYSRTRSLEITDTITERDMSRVGLDVVWITDSSTQTPFCKTLEGKYFSRFGETPGLPELKFKPPFHPNCRHQALPVSGDPVSKYIRINKALDEQIRSERAGWTPAERRSVAKMQAWNLAHRA